MLLIPNVCFRTMSSVPPNVPTTPVEETSNVTKGTKSTKSSKKKRNRGSHLFDDVGAQNIIKEKRTRKSATTAKEKIQIVRELESEDESVVFDSKKALEDFNAEGQPIEVIHEKLQITKFDDTRSYTEISVPDDVQYPLILPDEFSDLEAEWKRRCGIRQLAIRRLQAPELFVHGVSKKSPEELQVALAKQVVIAKQHLKIYSEEWVDEALGDPFDCGLVADEKTRDPEYPAALERLKAVRKHLYETRFGKLSLDENEAAEGLMQLKSSDMPFQVIFKPQRSQLGNLVVDLPATFQTAKSAEPAMDVGDDMNVQRPKAVSAEKEKTGTREQPRAISVEKKKVATSGQPKPVSIQKKKSETSGVDRGEIEVDSRCKFDAELLEEAKTEFGFDYKVDWSSLVHVVHRNGTEGLWSELTELVDLVRREIYAKVEKFVVKKLKAGPKLE